MKWFKKPTVTNHSVPEATSILYDESTFYNRFTHDLLKTKQEIIIECPFVTTRRLEKFKQIFEKLINKGLEVFV